MNRRAFLSTILGAGLAAGCGAPAFARRRYRWRFRRYRFRRYFFGARRSSPAAAPASKPAPAPAPALAPDKAAKPKLEFH